jgi:hypothetical protein
VEAATAAWYKVSLPGGEKGFISGTNVIAVSSPIRKMNLKNVQSLLDQPTGLAAKKATLPKGQGVNILAVYNGFYYVESDKEEGWVDKKAL